MLLQVRSDPDVALMRQRVRQAAALAGLGLVEQTKLVTAASELARNTLVHGGGGSVEVTPVSRGATAGLRLRFSDSGPGIPDVELAMTDGWTTAGGLGLGLSGSRRLVHEFALDTVPGQGTTVTIASWAAPTTAPPVWSW
ncbi:anti-sigma regulatory factor [Embleya scabrispora]|nr:anti-sigma regulatory factor [Embleya scabrispora]